MKTSNPNFVYSLWFDKEAEEAARFYTSAFPDSKVGYISYYGNEGFEIHGMPAGTAMSVNFTLSGMKFQGINGGPIFKINPSVSFFVVCETEEETQTLWNTLLEGGAVLMPLEKQEWSEKYGWLHDRYGLTWQISLGKISDVGQKITPSFLFTGKQFGRAKEAIDFYTSVFPDSGVTGITNSPEGNLLHGQFSLGGQEFMIMESGDEAHNFPFNEAVSIMINCRDQKEIDYYWEKLTADGGQESQCGWLKDKFGVSWQVVPVQLGELLNSSDKKKTARVTKAFLRMKKFDIATLEEEFAKA